jgi:hypothetical protein
MAPSDPAVIGKVEPVPEIVEDTETDTSTSQDGEPKRPLCTPPEMDSVLVNILQKVQRARGRRLFAFIPGTIDEETRDEVHRWRCELKEAGEADGLDILIHAPGGMLSSCYQIARLFGSRVDAWEALIPSMAASGATLISLGSAKIVMSEIAQLGPIDPQVGSRRLEKLFATERQSPLEAFEAVKYLRQFALTSLDANMRFLLERRIAPKPALDSASQLAFHLVQPILSKIEPYDLGSFALDSRLAVQYCERVGNPDNPAKKTQRAVSYRKLVEQYPAHEFVIDMEEAKALEFNVAAPAPDVDALFDELRPHLEKVEVYIGFVPVLEE